MTRPDRLDRLAEATAIAAQTVRHAARIAHDAARDPATGALDTPAMDLASDLDHYAHLTERTAAEAAAATYEEAHR